MGQGNLPILQPYPVPTGTEAYEAKRKGRWDQFGNKVPKEYHIPQHLLESPPNDVTTIPAVCGILTPTEFEITENYDATSLAEAIANRKYTAVEVVQAFLKRAIICHQVTCCLTQWFPESAIAQAQALDDHLARTGKTVGPLHGVPISIKEHIPIEGLTTNFGLIAVDFPAGQDSLLVSILRRQGAVFYVKTHQPQCLMHIESDSWWGRTLNPHNINLSSGGSSGGEGALLAMRGSILGVGTDIGGSIRCPAAFCGIYGFKPTAYILPMRDMLGPGISPELNVLAAVGPLGHSIRDMDLFMRLVLEKKPYLEDANVVPIPWTGLSTELPSKPLKVGIMLSNGMLTPQPPVLRALEYAREKLKSSGAVEVKPFTLDGEIGTTLAKMWNLNDWWVPESGVIVQKILAESGEPVHPLTQLLFDAVGDKPPKTIFEVTELRTVRNNFRNAFARHWTNQDVDVVICPVSQGPAPAHDTAVFVDYTGLWNILDYPGVVIPTPIKAKAKGVEDYASAEPLNESDAHSRKLWKENDYENAPIGLQIVARKYHDNSLFGALKVLQGLLELE